MRLVPLLQVVARSSEVHGAVPVAAVIKAFPYGTNIVRRLPLAGTDESQYHHSLSLYNMSQLATDGYTGSSSDKVRVRLAFQSF